MIDKAMAMAAPIDDDARFAVGEGSKLGGKTAIHYHIFLQRNSCTESR